VGEVQFVLRKASHGSASLHVEIKLVNAKSFLKLSSSIQRLVIDEMHWRRKWQPTPVFLPGESQGQRSLMGCCLWGRTESDTTEAT